MKTASFFLFVIFVFALDNPVSAALPSNELWREGLINNVVGFGQNTTGGAGGSLCRVTNLNNSSTGSLRACAEHTDPQWIVFDVSGTINLTSEIRIKSNKTIDGRGANITVSGRGFFLGGTVPAHNVIIHNIKIDNVSVDGISIQDQSSNVWVDHVTFSNAGDEQLHIGSTVTQTAPPFGITISWNHFKGFGTAMAWLISDPSFYFDANITITAHHNHYDQGYNRHPLARWAKIHAFNNYFNKNIQGVDARTKVQYYSESEIFEKNNSGVTVMLKAITGDPAVEPEGALNAKVLNPWLINGATVEQVNPSTIFNPSSYYAYTVDTANAALKTSIVSGAGWQNVTTPISLQAPTNLVAQ